MRYVVFYEVGEYDKYAEIEEFNTEKELCDFINGMKKKDLHLVGCYQFTKEVRFKAVETVTRYEVDHP